MPSVHHLTISIYKLLLNEYAAPISRQRTNLEVHAIVTSYQTNFKEEVKQLSLKHASS